MDYVSGTSGYEDRQHFPFPDVMLLDFRMPCVGGLEVLAWLQMRSFPDLHVIVLSHSFAEEDMQRSLSLGAKLCLPKGEPTEDARSIAAFCKDSISETRRYAAH